MNQDVMIPFSFSPLLQDNTKIHPFGKSCRVGRQTCQNSLSIEI